MLLTQILQQSEDADTMFVELLSRLRVGKCTNEDYQLLQSRLLSAVCPSWDDERWLDAPILVSNNEAKDALNERATFSWAQCTGRQVH